ncbi:hypothetical protein EFU40_09475 [Vibrio cholerae]|nr:hypothetical protein [Vibrio cholerae]
MNPLLSAHCSCSQEIAQQFAHYQHISGEGEIYQTSLMSALIAGVYEGATTIAQLLEHGDFGLGTFNELDLVVDTPVSRDFLEANLTPNNIRTAIEAAEK